MIVFASGLAGALTGLVGLMYVNSKEVGLPAAVRFQSLLNVISNHVQSIMFS